VVRDLTKSCDPGISDKSGGNKKAVVAGQVVVVLLGGSGLWWSWSSRAYWVEAHLVLWVSRVFLAWQHLREKGLILVCIQLQICLGGNGVVHFFGGFHFFKFCFRFVKDSQTGEEGEGQGTANRLLWSTFQVFSFFFFLSGREGVAKERAVRRKW
jgi:hypothetical protein